MCVIYNLPAGFMQTEENVVWEEEMNKIILNPNLTMGVCFLWALTSWIHETEENVVCEEEMNKIILNPNSDYGCVILVNTYRLYNPWFPLLQPFSTNILIA